MGARRVCRRVVLPACIPILAAVFYAEYLSFAWSAARCAWPDPCAAAATTTGNSDHILPCRDDDELLHVLRREVPELLLL